MKKKNYSINEKIEKLKKSNYFDEETLDSIREDLDALDEEKKQEKEKKIDENNKTITEIIPKKNLDNYFRLGFN